MTLGSFPFSVWTLEHQDPSSFLPAVLFVLFFESSFMFSQLGYNFRILNMQRGGNTQTRNLVWCTFKICLTTAKQAALHAIEPTSSN